MLAIMLIMIVLLVYRIIMIKQIEQTQVAKDVVRLHTVAASTILFYAMTILDINDTVALASYGLYFWCSDFLLILFFIYINDFTQETFVNKRGGLILGILIAIDGILCGFNVYDQMLFSVVLSGDKAEGYYYKVTSRTWLYSYHKLFVYMFAVMTFLLLAYEIYKAARIYVKQYYAILYCFLLMIATNVVYEALYLEFTELPLPASIILHFSMCRRGWWRKHLLWWYKISQMVLSAWISKDDASMPMCMPDRYFM